MWNAISSLVFGTTNADLIECSGQLRVGDEQQCGFGLLFFSVVFERSAAAADSRARC